MSSVIFFFKQKTAYEMRISDWSSDVCSSDLSIEGLGGSFAQGRAGGAGLAALLRTVVFGSLRRGAKAWQRVGYRFRWPGVRYRRWPGRSEERRVGKEGVSTGRSRWAPSH